MPTRSACPLYESICEKRALFGEWIFSYLLFRDNPKRVEYPRLFKPVFEQVAKESGYPVSFFEDMAARTAPQFLTWAQTAIDWGQYKIVGFTSTFDQNVASLTMAKLIKDLYPDVTIVFGGANYDGEMGTGILPGLSLHRSCGSGGRGRGVPAIGSLHPRGKGRDRSRRRGLSRGNGNLIHSEPRRSSRTSRRPVRPTMTTTIICWLSWEKRRRGSIGFCSTKVRGAAGGERSITVRFVD